MINIVETKSTKGLLVQIMVGVFKVLWPPGRGCFRPVFPVVLALFPVDKLQPRVGLVEPFSWKEVRVFVAASDHGCSYREDDMTRCRCSMARARATLCLQARSMLCLPCVTGGALSSCRGFEHSRSFDNRGSSLSAACVCRSDVGELFFARFGRQATTVPGPLLSPAPTLPC